MMRYLLFFTFTVVLCAGFHFTKAQSAKPAIPAKPVMLPTPVPLQKPEGPVVLNKPNITVVPQALPSKPVLTKKPSLPAVKTPVSSQNRNK